MRSDCRVDPVAASRCDRRVVVALVQATLACLAFTGASAQRPPPPAFTVAPLPAPARLNSSAAQLTVEGDRMILSWIERGDHHATLKFAERTPAGWSDARVVIESEALVVNAADVPSVRLLPDGTLAAHWTEENRRNSEAGTLRLAWSGNGGRTWTPPVTVHDDRTQTQHAFASIVPAADGGTRLLWLDGRTTNPDAKAPRQAGNMALRARLFDKAGKPGPEAIVDDRVCECCPIAAAPTRDGVVAAFRDRSDEEVRDVFVTRFAGGRWSTPASVSRDGWTIDACPVNGPSIAARDTQVVVAWFTGAGGQGRSFAAFSRDGGRTFGEPVRIDDASSTGHVQVAWIDERSAAVSWIEFAGASQFRARRVDTRGRRSAPVTIASGVGTQTPRLASARGELVFAWAEATQGTQRVRTARASLP